MSLLLSFFLAAAAYQINEIQTLSPKSSYQYFWTNNDSLSISYDIISPNNIYTVLSDGDFCFSLPVQGYPLASCTTAVKRCTRSQYMQRDPRICVILINPTNLNVKVNVTIESPSLNEDPLYPNQFELRNTGQMGGVAGEDIDVNSAWNRGLSGNGVVIDFLDDGVLATHEEFVGRVRTDLSFDYKTDSATITTPQASEEHGTAMIGSAAAGAFNSYCGRGVAYKASVAMHKILGPGITIFDQADALWNDNFGDDIHISSNSWGPSGCSSTGCGYAVIDPLIASAITNGASLGRNGLGRIYLFAAGNEYNNGGDANQYDYVKLRQVIAVGGTTNKGEHASYSNSGGFILVNAPSGGSRFGNTSSSLWPQITTTGISGTTACQLTMGTSVGTAIVSGAVALILEANPLLDWRDVQHILIRSTRINDPTDPSWFINGAGWQYSHLYGFGRVNLGNALKLADKWTSSKPEVVYRSSVFTPNQAIPDGDLFGVSDLVTVSGSGIMAIEFVMLNISLKHSQIGNLEISLISPSRTTTFLTRYNITVKSSIQQLSDYPLSSRAFYGEIADGIWSVVVKDLIDTQRGVFLDWSLTIFGTSVPDTFWNSSSPRDSQPSTTSSVSFDGSDSRGDFEQLALGPQIDYIFSNETWTSVFGDAPIGNQIKNLVINQSNDIKLQLFNVSVPLNESSYTIYDFIKSHLISASDANSDQITVLEVKSRASNGTGNPWGVVLVVSESPSDTNRSAPTPIKIWSNLNAALQNKSSPLYANGLLIGDSTFALYTTPPPPEPPKFCIGSVCLIHTYWYVIIAVIVIVLILLILLCVTIRKHRREQRLRYELNQADERFPSITRGVEMGSQE